ncbi:MAG: DNA cytosine methyltransferase [Candidatus Methanoplasma sp.]|jgi:DNA (cytosine-5)-methyltransferase 1|nr:DNA cytosine methyltransferase [Candidatus Methanoplasma sp.]
MYFNGLGRPIDLDGYANTLPASMGGNKTPIIDNEYLMDPSGINWPAEYHSTLWTNTAKAEFKGAPDRLRRITTLEAAAIQTFPADHIFKGTKSSIYAQIGNAVPCNMAEAVARSLIQVLDHQEKSSIISGTLDSYAIVESEGSV